jgi:ABC-2 type transport system ATP-binding protein
VRSVLRARIPELIDLVGLTPHRDKRLQAYSKGMLQRIGLAQALIHEPELIFLDEPTSGLDPMGRRLVRDIIRSQRDRGATVFLNSHLLSEIEVTCDRVCFIREGEVIANHDLRNFNTGKTTVRASVKRLSPNGLAGITQWGVVADHSGDFLTVHVSSIEAVPHLLRHLVSSGADVYEFTLKQMSLEDAFVSAVGVDRGF